jgi:hypothetical protein
MTSECRGYVGVPSIGNQNHPNATPAVTTDKGDTAYCHRKTNNNSHNDGTETLIMTVIGYCQLTQRL